VQNKRYARKKGYFVKIIYIAMVLTSFLLIGCSSLQQHETSAHYKRALQVSVNGIKFAGVGVAAFSNSYKIVVINHKKMDFLSIQSCSRSIDIEGPYFKKRVMKNRKEYHFTYSPLDFERECLLQFIVADKDGEHTVSTIAFEPKDAKLKADIDCNGVPTLATGESLCQSKAGLLQRITFGKSVLASKGCGFAIRSAKEFKFPLPLGDYQCVFMDENQEMFVFRGYGWNRILLLSE
jgi:hypothetical protein